MRFTVAHMAFFALSWAALLLAEGTRVRLEPSRISLGRFPANCPPSAEFILVNEGDAPLEGIRIRTGCGCLSALPDGEVVQPGGQLHIRLSIAQEKLAGPFSHGVFVEAGENLLRASVTGEAVPLFAVRPQHAIHLGDVVCGAPLHAEFLLTAEEAVTLGRISAIPLEAEVIKLSSASFRIVLRVRVPAGPGHFRLSASVPVVSPVGWNPVELTVFGHAAPAFPNAVLTRMHENESKGYPGNSSHEAK